MFDGERNDNLTLEIGKAVLTNINHLWTNTKLNKGKINKKIESKW